VIMPSYAVTTLMIPEKKDDEEAKDEPTAAA
jgi:hypothetical protein